MCAKYTSSIFWLPSPSPRRDFVLNVRQVYIRYFLAAESLAMTGRRLKCAPSIHPVFFGCRVPRHDVVRFTWFRLWATSFQNRVLICHTRNTEPLSAFNQGVQTSDFRCSDYFANISKCNGPSVIYF